jgi:hypothetical protein
MVAGLPEISAATAIGGPVGGFAALSGSEALGRGRSAKEVARETAKGATLGAVFKGAGHTGSVAKELGTIGAGTAATELAFGATPEEAAKSAGANLLFAGGMKALGGRRAKEPEIATPAPPIKTETAALAAKVSLPAEKPIDTRRPEDFLPSFFRVKSTKPIAPEETYAGTIQGTEIREPRRPARATVAGAETQISIPDSAEKYAARYTVREAEDVEASHEHQSFNPNPNYHYTNDRNYASNSEYRMRVMERSGEKFDPREVVNTSPTLDTGPPAWDAEGNALGGNSRVMILKRVYDKGGEGAARYKEEVMRQASLLGIDPEAVAKMERPILGRELIDEKTDYQRAISNLNRPSAAPLTFDELSSAQAKQLRPEMADYIAR